MAIPGSKRLCVFLLVSFGGAVALFYFKESIVDEIKVCHAHMRPYATYHPVVSIQPALLAFFHFVSVCFIWCGLVGLNCLLSLIRTKAKLGL